MTEDQMAEEKFDTILKRLLNSKPITKAEISAKIKAEREAQKKVQKQDNSNH